MPDILAIDTYSDDCQIAFLRNGGSAIRVTSEPRSQASKLAVFAASLIKEVGSSPKGVLVVHGPGSYTGLRIGVSTAKGLAWSLDVPLYALSTLHYLALSHEPLQEGMHIVSAIKARVDEVFAAHFSITNGILCRISPDAAMTHDTFSTWIEEQCPTSEVVVDQAGVLESLDLGNRPIHVVHPRIESVCPLLSNQLNDFCVKDLNSFEPAYLKEFVARKASKSIFERLPF